MNIFDSILKYISSYIPTSDKISTHTKNFYSYWRGQMETDDIVLIALGVIALVIFFFNRINLSFSLLPLSCMILRYVGSLVKKNTIIDQINNSILIFFLASYMLTYITIYLYKILLLLCIGVGILMLSNEFPLIFKETYYNWLMIGVLLLVLYLVNKLQNISLNIFSSFYASVIILNSIEVLVKGDLGMKTFEPLGVILTGFLIISSILIQSVPVRTKKE